MVLHAASLLPYFRNCQKCIKGTKVGLAGDLHCIQRSGRKAIKGFFSQSCQIAKFDPFLSLDFTRVEGVGAQSKERRKGSNFAA